MTNDLLVKAAALLEARNALPESMAGGQALFGGTEIIEDFPQLRHPNGSEYTVTARYLELAANTSAEIITGYQDLVRRMADALTAAESWTDPEYDIGEWRDAAMQIRDEAKAAIHHTPTTS